MIKLDILEIKHNVRLVSVDGVPKLVNRNIGIILEINGTRVFRDIDYDLTMYLNVADNLPVKSSLDLNTDRPYFFYDRLMLPITALKDVETLNIDIVDEKAQVIRHILQVTYTDALGERKTFNVTLSVSDTEEKKKIYSIRDDWYCYGIELSVEDIQTILKHYKIEKL